MEIEIEPRFLEEAVRCALVGRPDARAFHRERERVYEIPDRDARAAAFDALSLAWGARLDLVRPVRCALAAEPLIETGVDLCTVGRPPTPNDVGAELIVRAASSDAGSPRRVVRLLVRPEWLLDEATLTPLLRRELRHVADMLDPAFGYEPHLAIDGVARGMERLVRDRYRAAWNTSVDGRLVHAGLLDAAARAQRWDEFTAAFGTLDAAASTAFAALFEDPAPTHARLLALATAPRTVVVGPDAGPVLCPLCGCPSARGLCDGSLLGEAVQAEIYADRPGWDPQQGCCRHCADLYEFRPLSRAAAATLPGIR